MQHSANEVNSMPVNAKSIFLLEYILFSCCTTRLLLVCSVQLLEKIKEYVNSDEPCRNGDEIYTNNYPPC